MLTLKGLLATTALSASLGCTTNVYAETEVSAGGGVVIPPPVVLIDDTFDTSADIANWTDDPEVTSSWTADHGGSMYIYKSIYGYFSTYRSFPTEVGKFYKIEGQIHSGWNAGYIIVSNGTAHDDGELGRPVSNSTSAAGSIFVEGTGNLMYIHLLNEVFTSTWVKMDNIKVTEYSPIEVFNYDFATDIADWSVGTSATVSHVATGGGRIRVQTSSNGHGAYLNFDTEIGKTYELNGTLAAQNWWSYMRRETAAGGNLQTMIDSNSSPVTAKNRFAGTGAQMRVNLYTLAGNWAEFDNIRLRDITPPA